MSCNIGQNIGFMLVGWVIGIVVFACFFMLCFYVCTVYYRKCSFAEARKYMNVWFFYVPVAIGLLLGLTIDLLLGGLVCFETTRAIGFGCLISSQSLNLCYNLGYNVLNCFFRKTDEVSPSDEEKKEPVPEEKKEPAPV